jgi:amino acid transporter
VAFYVIAFTEAFEPFFNYALEKWDLELPRQVISLPAMGLLSLLILKRGASMGVKALYFVVAILFASLTLFFLGQTDYVPEQSIWTIGQGTYDLSSFFIVFAIVFPAFTGMTAGVGLSGDLKKPARSIPLGTTLATLSGMVIYIFIAWKLYTSASPDDLKANQLIMSKIALYGALIIPLGLAASTISSALGSVMVAPRTLQALAMDRAFPVRPLNRWLSKGKRDMNEPYNASLLTCLIAFIFVAAGNINAVAEIISMFFMVTYGSLCLISFLFHFGADPSYRPVFRSKWYISLIGFLMCGWLMFKINSLYAIFAIAALVLVYLGISSYHKDRRGLESIFSNAIFQLSRNIQIYLQKRRSSGAKIRWRPSTVCITDSSFERQNALRLLNWISYRYGFGTYIHYISNYFSKSSREDSKDILEKLLTMTRDKQNNIYIDTMISPSYTSAIAQVIQIPGVSGMENNTMLLEFDKKDPRNLKQIVENFSLIEAANHDVCILGSSPNPLKPKKGIHIWIRSIDYNNANLMILLGFIISSHPEMRRAQLKVFEITFEDDVETTRKKLLELIQTGRLPISQRNVEILRPDEETDIHSLINEHSAEAALTIIGIHSDQLRHDGEKVFKGYESIGDTLYVNARTKQEIN